MGGQRGSQDGVLPGARGLLGLHSPPLPPGGIRVGKDPGMETWGQGGCGEGVGQGDGAVLSVGWGLSSLCPGPAPPLVGLAIGWGTLPAPDCSSLTVSAGQLASLRAQSICRSLWLTSPLTVFFS